MAARALPTHPLTDGELIVGSRTVPDTFHELFDRHFVAVYRYLARRVGRDRADDLASQTFAVAFARRATFRDDATDARPWLLGIATKLLLNERRAEQRALDTVARLEAQTTPPATDITRRFDLDHEIGAAILALDPDQRDVLLLFAWGELSYEEIALALTIPVGTVRSRMSRARTQLRARLELSTHAEEDPR